MRASTAVRHVREGFRNVVRNGWMSFASVSAITISLFILGVFVLLALNVNGIAKQIESEVEIRVFLDVNVNDNQITALQNEIASNPDIKKVTFISKEQGLEILRETLGKDNQSLLEGLDKENPLPDSFTVEVFEPRQVANVAEKIKAINEGKFPKPFVKVDYGYGTVEMLFKATTLIRNVGLVLVAGLALTAMFLISNTIKLTIMARRREISIMKLVGATNSFIRWPFFIEGAILGLVGSAVPTAVLLYGYAQLVEASKVNLGLMLIHLIPLDQIVVTISGLLIGIGVVIGIWGSTISVRKFLRV